jgi:hypothetical protein
MRGLLLTHEDKDARALGLSRTGLYKRMRAVGIPLPLSDAPQVDATDVDGDESGEQD